MRNLILLAFLTIPLLSPAAHRDPCRALYLEWRAARANAVVIGREYPRRVDSAWAQLRGCQNEQRER